MKRRNEWDEWIYRTVYVENEYRVPDRMDGWRVLDIGANIGCFARLCSERGARVEAYEPDPENYRALLGNMASLDGRVTGLDVACSNAAIADRNGAMNLHLDGNPTGSSLYRAPWVNNPTVVKVPTITLDQAIDGRPVDLCKIDAEGAEYLIIPSSEFAGVERLTVEFHAGFVRDYEERTKQCRERLRELGFRETSFEATYPDRGWFMLGMWER